MIRGVRWTSEPLHLRGVDGRSVYARSEPHVTHTHRSVRELPAGHQDDWSLLDRIERVLAERADEWDDGRYEVVLTDGIGEHRGDAVEEARSRFEQEGQGDVERIVLSARGGDDGPRCTVELAASDKGRIVAEHHDPTAAEDLAGAVERLVLRRRPRREDSGDGAPNVRVIVGSLLAAAALVVVAWSAAAAPLSSVLRNPWVVTIVGGLLASLLAWLVRVRLRRRGGG